MLKSLHIQNFAIIDRLELEFFNGLSVLTGETGAGKSIIIDAIGLVLGDRADINSIRAEKDSAEIVLMIDTPPDSACTQWLLAHDLEADSDCILRRVIRRDGKSRAYINNVPVPLKTLKELGERIINIYGQHAHQALMHTATQRELIDQFANQKKQLLQLRNLYKQWHEHKETLERLSNSSSDITATIELLRYQIDELDQLGMLENEYEELEQKHKRLANADQLQQSTLLASQRLKNEDGSDISSQLGAACTEVNALLETDKNLLEVNQSLEEAYTLVNDCANELRNYADSVEVDAQELAQIEQRLIVIDQIARKHKISASEIFALHGKLSAQLQELTKPEYDLDALQTIIENLESEYRLIAKEVSTKRTAAAAKLSKQVTNALKNLGMDKARMEMHIGYNENSLPSLHGLDTIELRVQTNPGQKMLPLSQVASGGELSRISLAIQMIAVDKLDVPVLIFDEVDAGVGGAIAEVVGKELRNIGEHRQVMCITHLAQVAANAHHHYRVNKYSDSADTVSAIDYLDRAERITEIARMLGGVKLTENTFLHAQEMLEANVQ